MGLQNKSCDNHHQDWSYVYAQIIYNAYMLDQLLVYVMMCNITVGCFCLLWCNKQSILLLDYIQMIDIVAEVETIQFNF